MEEDFVYGGYDVRFELEIETDCYTGEATGFEYSDIEIDGVQLALWSSESVSKEEIEKEVEKHALKVFEDYQPEPQEPLGD